MASSVPGEGSIPCKDFVPSTDSGWGSGEGSFLSEGSVPGKASVPPEGSVQGKEDPGRGSGEGSFPSEGSALVQGKGKDPGPSETGKVSVPVDRGLIRFLEYPTLSRFRLRRLLSFLACPDLDLIDAFKALQSKVCVFLDLTYLQSLLERCMWQEAQTYIASILPYHCMGVDGSKLASFFLHLMYMHGIARRHPMASQLITRFEHQWRDPAFIGDPNYLKVMHTVLSMRSQQVRPSVDWYLVGQKAAEIARGLITQSPEFSEFLRLPHRSRNIHNVINVFPCGFRPHGIRRVKKKADRVPVSVIAKFFLPKGRVQPAGQGTSCSVAGLSADPSAWLKRAIDEALQAGAHTALHQAHPVKFAYNEGMNQKRLWSNVSQDFDAVNYPKRPRKAGTWIPWIPSSDEPAA